MIYIPQGGSNFYLSENFKTWEFGCRCCKVVKVDEDLINALEELRMFTGGPIFITSGYRCPAHNRAVGGAKNSYHMKGMAADIYSKIVTPRELAAYADAISVFGGIGIYRSWVHVDVREEYVRWISNAA